MQWFCRIFFFLFLDYFWTGFGIFNLQQTRLDQEMFQLLFFFISLSTIIVNCFDRYFFCSFETLNFTSSTSWYSSRGEYFSLQNLPRSDSNGESFIFFFILISRMSILFFDFSYVERLAVSYSYLYIIKKKKEKDGNFSYSSYFVFTRFYSNFISFKFCRVFFFFFTRFITFT